MNESDEALKRLIKIDYRTESMADSLGWLVRANADGLREALVSAFGKSTRRVQVYLSLNGERSVGEVANHLEMKAPNVSTELRWLRKKGLVDQTISDGNEVVYQKKFFDAMIELSEALADKFKLNTDGHKD